MEYIKNIIKNFKRTKKNEDYVDEDGLLESLFIYGSFYLEDYYKPIKKIKAYWIKTWYCTDTWVGYKIYYLDDEPVAISRQLNRKSYTDFEWITKKAFFKTRDYVLSLFSKRKYTSEISLIDKEEEINLEEGE